MRDGTGQTTSEDRATQLLIWETLSLANTNTNTNIATKMKKLID